MDNISHSVAGLAAGELIHRGLPEEQDPSAYKLRRRLLLLTCWVASNFPDLDLILTPLLPAPLGYLLHHRGHTHTILYALPQALLLLAAIWFFWPSARQALQSSPSTRKGFALSMLVGFSLHMLMDYLNSYGIHPFHPFDSRWFYGDMTFIVEPFFWIAFGIPMVMLIQRKWLKALCGLFLLGVPFAFTWIGYLPWSSYALLVGVALILGFMQARAGARGTGALVLSAVLGLSFVALQSFASGQAKRAVEKALAAKDPESVFLDSSMTSFPTNPICWTFLSIEKNEAKGTYRMRRGILSLAPETLQANECPPRLAIREEHQETTPAFIFSSEVTSDLQVLRKRQKENCHFDAWMRFARAPLLTEKKAEDIRFQSVGPRGNFSEMKFDDINQYECSDLIPQWHYPRADLLTPPEQNSGEQN